MRISDWSSDVCSSDLRSPQAKRMRSWRVLRGKLPLQQAARQFGYGHALAEGGDLDACAQRGRHVERQAGRVKVAFVERIGIPLANPHLGVRIRGWTRTDAAALAGTRPVAGGAVDRTSVV